MTRAQSALLCRQPMRGFTLIELMIAVAVVAILAAIAYPSYQEQVLKSRRAEGKALIMNMAQSLERCYTRFSRYDDPGCAIATTLTGAGQASEGGWYLATGVINRNDFTLTAAPRKGQTKDSACGSLTLTHSGIRNITGSGSASTCWQ
ncbi:MAG TPA: type IV pilin protein [Candidatus Competibacteraceae bacterium]|nr:type IV pilin protein [Candidatus Competibacteraceae bacterium]